MPELPNIVRERLKAARTTSAHLDPDMITAFAERSLSEPERAVITEHLARCHDCRDILALALPVSVAVENDRTLVPVRGGWLRTPVLRWEVVAAGFAVLAVTGMLQYQNRRHSESFFATKQANAPVPEATRTQVSGNRDTEKPMPGTPSTGLSVGFGNAAPASATDAKTGSSDADSMANASTNQRAAAAAPMDETAPHSVTGGLNRPRQPGELPSGVLISSQGAANLVVSGPQKQLPQVSPHTASSTTVEVSGAAPLVSATPPDQADKALQYEAKVQPKDQPGTAGQRSFMDATVDKAKLPAVEFGAAAPAPTPSPTPSALAVRWAISTTGGLLRSFDQGVTWVGVDVSTSQSASMVSAIEVAAKKQEYRQAAQDTRQLQAQSQPAPTQLAPNEPAPNQTQTQAVSKSQAASLKAAPLAPSLPVFRAVSAAGLQVWAGGTAGMLYHSADGGRQWTRVVLVTSGILSTGDIVSIAFPDPLHGQITTSTQELWITLDAGQTWQKR